MAFLQFSALKRTTILVVHGGSAALSLIAVVGGKEEVVGAAEA